MIYLSGVETVDAMGDMRRGSWLLVAGGIKIPPKRDCKL